MEKQGVTVLYIDKYSFSYISDTQCDATSFLERLYEQEMQMQLGPAKGKDYANSMGPVIVTMDEVTGYAVDGDPQRFDMPTKLYRNGELLRENNVKTIYHTFGDMIAHASKLTAVYPGDVLGSGTIGGGALLEYLGKQPFIQAGDVIEMKVEGLGSLRMEVK